MEEKFLYHIWDAGHLAAELKTVSGKIVKIGYQGQFNTFRGPDFINCILCVGGEDLQGAVEIHNCTLDWSRHQHQEDHFYNNVVLHVVLNHNAPHAWTMKENGELVEILELQTQLSDDIQKLIRGYQEMPAGKTSNYCDRLSAIDSELLLGILAQHGKKRLLGKVKRFNASLALSDFDQILYEGLMEAAGYDKNKFNLLQLAQSITYSSLKTWYKEGMTLPEMQSIMLCSSGLLAKSNGKLGEAKSAELEATYEAQRFHARKLSIDWQLFRIRPASHPLNRLVVLMQFLYSCLEGGLLHAFLKHVEQSEPVPAVRYQRFCKLLSTVESSLLPGGGSFGKTVLNNMYINIYLPVLYLYAGKVAKSSLAESVLESWQNFGSLPENYITRFMCRHINTSQIKEVNKKSLYQQGLMDIYYRYCRYHLCNECTTGI